ncbi:aminotransferase class I/II-fold pyridoxal phosphate-dependent enzyme [Deinococcus sp. Marseille-Q6407]|uniref:aminotransferase class I/II-fold pyridoxal phosphate-dependent enzyme n=1 Tax=Deinococcus sp. Marseille-Q6407 TaxID=2969223 RepID=UPI0021C1AF06|nr:histidinol-phosphate transaminase [Deinococcus sp. Marseille-Q6407]
MNSNPYGPNPVLLEAVQAADQTRYPDPAYTSVRAALAGWHGVDPAAVALSVGASDLLHRCVRALSLPGEKLLSLHAPFGELARAAALQGLQVEVMDRVPAALSPGTRLVYLGQPHNPTGRCLPPAEVTALAGVCAAAGAWLLLDLAYAPFVGAEPLHHPAVINLLSPGKAHGLVGARPAYALADPPLCARLDNLAPAWHLPAGTAALLQALPSPVAQAFLHVTLPQVQASAAALAAGLRPLGTVEHHGTPFLTLEVGDAASCVAALLQRGLRVRDCASYGLPGHLRVSTQGPRRPTLNRWRP